jgi:hypothetical protein
MGGPSGGGDRDVSGAEAVATGGTTYSSRKTKTVNKLIESRNRSPKEKIGNFIRTKTTVGRVVTALEEKNNYKRRLDYAKKKGIKVRDKSKSFVLSDTFKTQLDARGYDDYNKGLMGGNVGGQGPDDNNKSIEQPKAPPQMDNTEVKSDLITADKTSPTTAEMDDRYDKDETGLRIKRRGRKSTLLTSNVGDTSKATLSKKVLLGG